MDGAGGSRPDVRGVGAVRLRQSARLRMVRPARGLGDHRTGNYGRVPRPALRGGGHAARALLRRAGGTELLVPRRWHGSARRATGRGRAVAGAAGGTTRHRRAFHELLRAALRAVPLAPGRGQRSAAQWPVLHVVGPVPDLGPSRLAEPGTPRRRGARPVGTDPYRPIGRLSRECVARTGTLGGGLSSVGRRDYWCVA